MRLKYLLSRTNLDKRHIVYFRPLFEYFCEIQIWDNCGIGNSQKVKSGSCQNCYRLTYFHKHWHFIYRNGLGIIICETEEKETSFLFITVNKNISNYLCTLISPPYKVHQCILTFINVFGFETYRLIGR
jgi:hypothetical protein